MPVVPPNNNIRPTPVGQIPVNPNFLIFAPDDLGREYLRAYARLPVHLQVPLPNLERLQQSGVTFTRAYSQPWCSPTRAAWLTGRGGWQTGIGSLAEGQNQPLLGSEICLPTALKLATNDLYKCSAWVKWHLSEWTNRGGAYEHPIRTGFDHFEGHLRNLETGDSYYSFNGFTADPSEDGQGITVDKFHVAEWAPEYYVRRCGEWIRAQEGPWLVWFAINLPHIPYNRPPSYTYDTSLYSLPDAAPANVGSSTTPTFFKAMLQALDWTYGQLLEQIPQAQRANTVILWWSDNGTQAESFDTLAKTGIDLEPWLGPNYPNKSKRTVYEIGVNVPLFVSGPMVRAPGRVSQSLISPADLFATILDLSGGNPGLVPLPTGGTRISTSFANDLRNSTPSSRTYVPIDLFGPNGPNYDCTTSGSRGLALQDWKLIRKSSTGVTGFPSGTAGTPITGMEFYDLVNDPNETNNLIGSNPINLTGATLTAYDAAVAQYATAFSSP